MKEKRPYIEMLAEAEKVKTELAPHCERIAIAGSIRRKKAECADIEIVAIPHPYNNSGMFVDGIASVVNQWEPDIGELPCKYTRRKLSSGIQLDLFFATKENWGLILAIRTGSADYSHYVLARGWCRKGYHSINGFLHDREKKPISVPEETRLFELIGIPYVSPEFREYTTHIKPFTY